MRVLICGAGLAAALIASGCAHQPEAAPPAPDRPAAALASVQDTDQFIVHSRITGKDFVIQVARPILTAPPAAGQTWPAVYVLDGTYLFGMMTPMERLLPFERAAQAAYVVGVGFPEEQFAAYGQRRNTDLIHIQQTSSGGQTMGGGGALMERFLKEELRPLIESRYPVDPRRAVLAGHSLGGLFTATVLANDPTAFSGYMIGSPSLQFDPGLPDRVRAAAPNGGGRRVFIGVGAAEPTSIPRADALEAALRVDGAQFVTVRKTFADETHVSGQGAWISGGLRHVLPFAPPTQAAPPAGGG